MVEPHLEHQTVKIKQLIDRLSDGPHRNTGISTRLRLEKKQGPQARRFPLSRLPNFLFAPVAEYRGDPVAS
jgi:hypothetical protein